MKTSFEHYYDIERILEMDFVRATESAALHAAQWIGRGDKQAADSAACDAIRGMFDLMDISGEVVIGESGKDHSSSIAIGEHLGTWMPGTERVNFGIDPIDGSRNIASGALNAISCIVAARPEDGIAESFCAIPSAYMTKLSYGPTIVSAMENASVEAISLRHPIEETIHATARILRKRLRDVVVLVMDRPRHQNLIEEIRAAGATIRLVGDGDIAMTLAPSIPDSGIDLYAGIGGSSEAIMAAAGLRCLGGDIQCMIWPKDDSERQAISDQGRSDDLAKVYRATDLAIGKNIIFCATGISDSPLVKGVLTRRNVAVTHSILMRTRSGTIREITTQHDLHKKTIHLRSDNREHKL